MWARWKWKWFFQLWLIKVIVFSIINASTGFFTDNSLDKLTFFRAVSLNIILLCIYSNIKRIIPQSDPKLSICRQMFVNYDNCFSGDITAIWVFLKDQFKDHCFFFVFHLWFVWIPDSIYVSFVCGWYIHCSPSEKYRSTYKNSWGPHSAVWSVVSLIMNSNRSHIIKF